MSNSLKYSTFVTPPLPQHSGNLNLPNGDPIAWSPQTTTLIYGNQDAALIDPPFTTATAGAVLDWVEGIERTITDIYITHGHGDHWFGTPVILERYPEAIVHATANTRAQIVSPASAQARTSFWEVLFPNEIPTAEFDVQVAGDRGIVLEGNELLPIEVGHSDTDDSTVLWVPDLRLAVAGDVVYNDVHLSLAESVDGGRDAWRRALDIVSSLDATHVVAGHKNPASTDAPAHIALTRKYLDDVDEHLVTSSTPLQFFEAMTRLHPQRLNPGVLWVGANALL